MKKFRSRVKGMNVGGVKYKVHMSRYYNDLPKKMADQNSQHIDDYNWSIYIDSDKVNGKTIQFIFEDETPELSGRLCCEAYKSITRKNIAKLLSGGVKLEDLLCQ